STDSRSATTEPVPSTTSRARRIRKATSSEDTVQPQRRLDNPYDLVRLLVEMNTSLRVAASGATAADASRYTSSTRTCAPARSAIRPTSSSVALSAATPVGLWGRVMTI